MKRNGQALGFILLIAALTNVLAILLIVPAKYAAKSALSKADGTGTIEITVTDAYTGLAIESATVCIPEADLYKKTGADGKTGSITVPLKRNQSFDGIVRRGYGEVTVLVYADGYTDYIIFYIMVFADTHRLLSVPLYQGGGSHSIIEGPLDEWVGKMIEKYKK